MIVLISYYLESGVQPIEMVVTIPLALLFLTGGGWLVAKAGDHY